MLQLLHPIWLLAGTAVIIPLALHLWNTRQGKVLQVGSVQLMQQSARRASFSRRFSQLWLLLLRCLLLLLLALLLSQPVWKSSFSASHQAGWVLIENNNSKATYTHFKPAIDSLLQAGFQLRYLQSGFPPVDTGKLHNHADSVTVNNYWALLPALTAQAPPNTQLYLYTTNRLNQFTGNRPVISSLLHWFTYTPNDSVSTYIQQAWLTTGNQLKIAVVKSMPSGNSVSYQQVPAVAGQVNGFTISQTNNHWQISYNGQPPVSVDTTTLHIALYNAEYQHDATYIQAAIEAIRNYTQRRIELIVTDKSPTAATNVHWLFWLSAKRIPENWKAAHILQYHPGKEQACHSFLQTGQHQQTVLLHKRTQVNITSDSLYALWQDGEGQPVLYTLYTQPGTLYFTSRFNPAWSNITWQPSFPILLAQLLMRDNETSYTHITPDNRAIDTLQLQPQVQYSATATAINEQPVTALSQLCWLLAAVTLLAERLLAHKTKGGQANA